MNNIIHIPPALVLGCNTSHGIGVISDWIEEQTGHAPDFVDTSWSDNDSDSIFGDGFGYGNGLGTNYSDKYCDFGDGDGYGDGGGSGSGYGYGFGYHRRSDGRGDGI